MALFLGLRLPFKDSTSTPKTLWGTEPHFSLAKPEVWHVDTPVS